MRVLELSSTYLPTLGGVPYHVASLSEGLRARGHQVDVLTSTPGPADASTTRVGGKPWEMAGALRRALKRERYDVVHAHDPLAAFLAARATQRTGIASVASIHDLWPACPRGTYSKTTIGSAECDGKSPAACAACSAWSRPKVWALDSYHRHAYDRLTSVVAVSGYVRSVIARFFDADKVTVIHNWVDLDRYRPDPAGAKDLRRAWGLDDRPFLFFMSRLIPEKGVQHLLAAMPELLREHPRAQLVVGSRGWYAEPLKAQAKALGLGESVTFPGALPANEIVPAYSAADVVVYPAIASETFSFVPLEAQACGAAVLASTHGGTPEGMTHGETGWLVPPGQPRALFDGMRTLLADAGLRRRLGEAGQKNVAARFDKHAKVAEYEAHFAKLAGR